MSVFRAAAEAIQSGRPAAMVTIIGVNGSAPRSAGARMLVYEDGCILGTIGGGALEHRAIATALRVLDTGTPARLDVHLTRDLGMCCGGAMEIYVEPVHPRPRAVLFGAGHVAAATAPVLQTLGFAVTVVDERDEFCSESRFPGCTRLDAPREVARSLEGGAHSYWLVVTHDHQLDQDLGEILLPKQCAWLGMIGSRSKIAKFFLRYKAAGLDPALFEKLSAPVGLDIGAETPEEIAVAIAAEIIRVRRASRRPPIPLSEIPLNARGGTGIASPPALGD